MREFWPAMITRHQRDCGGKIAPCAVPRNRKLTAIHTKARRIRCSPHRRIITVLQRHWIRMLRREPIRDGKHRRFARIGKCAAGAVMRVNRSDHPAATVKIDR